MSYRVSVSGKMVIEPPLTYAEIREDSRWQEYRHPPDLTQPGDRRFETWKAVKIKTTKVVVETDDGPLTRITGTEVEVNSGEARDLDDDLQELVEAFPGHRWVGGFDAEGEENTDMFRVYVRHGTVIVVRPQIIWPDPPADDPPSVT